MPPLEKLPPLRGIEKHRLLEATRKVDEVMNKIEVGNITKLNDLVYAGAVVVTEMLGVKQLNKDLRHISTLIERKNIKKKHKDGTERRYKIK